MLDILQLYYEPFPSGQTTHVLSLTEGLLKNGHKVTVALPSWFGKEITAFAKAGAAVAPLKMGKVIWKAQAMIDLASLLRRGMYQIVHIHSQEAGLMGRPLAFLSGAKAVVYTPQTVDLRQDRLRRPYRLIERTLSHITDKVISVNEIDRTKMIEWGISPKKVVSIPNGVDLARHNKLPDLEQLSDSLGITSKGPIVMQMGRLSAQKDPIAFVEGALLISRECPQAQFIMVGDGPLQAAVEKRINKHGLEDRFHLVGRREQGYKLAALAHVVTLTSRWEGTPYSILEAMAWSKPVVATSVNGCVEIVLDGITGFLSPPDDLNAWAGHVSHLLKNPALATVLGRQGRQLVEIKFTLNNMIESIENLYFELVNT